MDLQRIISAFPSGRTTGDLLRILGYDLDPPRRRELLTELHRQTRSGHIVLEADRKWRVLTRAQTSAPSPTTPIDSPSERKASEGLSQSTLLAVPARFEQIATETAPETPDDVAPAAPSAQALLRYYASTLRADPRGAMAQGPDRHGVKFQLLAGRGIWWGGTEGVGRICIELDNLPAHFREALIRRENLENALAVGWPLAVGRKIGVPVIWPVGLIAARWERHATQLQVLIETASVMVNPDWIKAAARNTAWTEAGLREVFSNSRSTEPNASSGLSPTEFLDRLKEAMASAIRGRLTGLLTQARLDSATPGIFDAMGLFLHDEESFTAGAARDLDALADWSTEQLSQTALGALHGHPAPPLEHPAPTLNVGPLNAEQLQACASAMRHALTVVTGPPGTGKTETIVSIVASALVKDQRVLVASKNHQALDAVESRLLAIAPEAAFMVRTLDPRTERDQSLNDVLAQLINQPAAAIVPQDETMLAGLAQLTSQREQTLALQSERRRLHTRLAEHIERRNARQPPLPGNPTPASAKPVQGLLAKLLGWFRRSSTASVQDSEGRLPDGVDLATLEQCIRRDRDKLAGLPEPTDPVALGEQIALIAKPMLEQHLRSLASITESDRLALTNAYRDRQLDGMTHPDYPLAAQVIEHRPLWLASILGTPRRLPLHAALFDLVVFDEASQCDIASALPLLARSSRAVVVGDERQLAFIPQIGARQDRNLMTAQGLPETGMGRYAQGRCSLFDLARSLENVPAVMLREQYRSAPQIVDYLNQSFYGNRLRSAINETQLKVPRGAKPGLVWTDVPGRSGLQQSGSNVNEEEAQAITKHLETLFLQEQYGGSVGVITPFRHQVLALERALQSALPADTLQTADLRVATIDGFQGQERDLILFSPVVFSGSPHSGQRFFENDWRRLNVAISRARAVVHIFGDLAFARSGQLRSLTTLAARATEPPKRSGETVFDSHWERIVDAALRQRGLDPIPQYDIAGRRLDFALFGTNGIKLDLEVDGRHYHQDPDGFRKLDDYWRDHQLRSLGWRVRRFWVDELDHDLQACIDLVEQDLR